MGGGFSNTLSIAQTKEVPYLLLGLVDLILSPQLRDESRNVVVLCG